jgi:hypothetical protein
MPVWLELHVDDEVLGLDSARWPEARALIVRIARLAEARDARICFRLRETFARHAKGDPILPQLAAAGHELGVHAHGRGFARAAEAVRACGVEVQVAVPGLVQVGADGREPLLRQVASLGFSLVTDHGPSQVWAYEGLASRPEAGLVVMAPTVRPTDWGLISMDGQRQGFRAECVVRLRKLEAQARAQGADYFGVAMHEHDLCPIGSLEPTPGALEALGQWLDSRVGPSRSCVPLREPRSDRRVADCFVGAPRWSREWSGCLWVGDRSWPVEEARESLVRSA